ncbi:Na/Pi-cotransporter II-related protein [uncultured Flavonifractor sp.]|uniref:Na/Pi cotransporter family protein n=1 Tax=Flintibacter hominis TaxID=2763048 RepID=A0A8J6J294_9FIRM|nr:Na/Pi cotransporter family protein [Flintibacter hominis]MBC5722914.1 Na/Pi cotransporter family protein [Flintibacter hominis]MBS5591432.1 Na/Pi cotransporter family protein [Clostridiales bacterium]SCI64736.1 Na/Pi-cotransporter II-related protein [uncultured Flavonifractor sp.]
MGISEILGLLGGLALFLHGMQMMSSGLEAAAGARMKSILERLTANRFLGVLVGAAITAVIQSSSATTVMVVGFVNAGMMTLGQAVWIIMGANIGTTVTGLLIALDVGELAPMFAFVGVVLMVFVKEPKLQHIGQILAGLGVLFIGMGMMSSSMSPLRDSEPFIRIMSTFSNPLLGILAGAAFTAVIQSSSASVGILQALASSGVISYASSVFVLFGQNIGTCITAVLAAIGTNRNAKRATLIHLMFNLIGTAIFTTLFVLFPIAAVVEGTLVLPGEVGRTLSHLIPTDPMAQIAMTHTVFNITTTLVLLPLGNYLAKLAIRILPDQAVETEDQESMTLAYLTPIQAGGKEGGLGVSAIVIDQLRNELNRMLSMARDNVADSFRAVLARDQEQLVQVEQREEYIDFLNREISRYVSHLISIETNEQGSAVVSSFFTISGNIERIGDHADNLAGYTRMLVGKNISFSETAQSEISAMRDISLEAISALLHYQAGQPQWLSEVAQMEQKIDDMTDSFRRGQLQRMKEGTCNQEACILYSELLTDFERIGDHVLNIAEELTKAQTGL